MMNIKEKPKTKEYNTLVKTNSIIMSVIMDFIAPQT